MATKAAEIGGTSTEGPREAFGTGWRDFFLKEDWWAIWLGIGLMLIAAILFKNGSGLLSYLSVNPGGLKWSSPDQLAAHFGKNAGAYVAQFFCWLVLFGASCRVMGIPFRHFAPSFLFLYALSLVMFCIAGWVDAAKFNLEAPLVALVVGLLISNAVGLPKWMDSAFRVEYFVKVGIVLLGATFPITLVITAGPVAILQATIISLVTCSVIYLAATRLFGLDRRLSAVMGVGGAVCGVSASMAIAASVRARKEDLYTSVTLVVGWALVLIVLMPFASQALGLAAGVGGAWIGTSELADAAGFAAASAYGKMSGHEDAAVKAFTLMKVIGRDVWIGVWSIVWALIATIAWEERTGDRPRATEVWSRFPKFVIGFFVASLLTTLFTTGYTEPEFQRLVKPGLLAPLSSLRTWAFLFCFLSIGLTTRFRELKSIGWRPFAAFTIGVAVNVILGYYLSAYFFVEHWRQL